MSPVIDTHAHYLPQGLLDRLGREIGRFPSIELLRDRGQYRLAFAGRAPTRPISPKLRDAEQRAEWMHGHGIEIQIVSGWLDSFGYELPAAEGAAWSRFMNEHVLRETEDAAHFTPLGTVPLQDGRLAAAVLGEALDAGFTGVMIGTQPEGAAGNLDDPDLDPFWEAAAERGATVYLHPMFGCGDPRLDDYALVNAVGRGVDTTTAVARLLFSGHFTKYAGMRFILSHGGGALPYLLGRLARNWEIHPGEYADPVAGFRTLYFDSVLFDPAALEFLAKTAGVERIVLGSDYPFPIGDPDPTAIVRRAGFADREADLILGETAAALFGLGPSP